MPFGRFVSSARWSGVAARLGVWLLLVLAVPAMAARPSERARQKQQAEAQRADLQQKMAKLKHDIDDTEVAKTHAADALAESEAAISDADRALHDLEAEQQAEEAKLFAIQRLIATKPDVPQQA